ncbi:MAG: hypothetical protein QOI41_6457 [Myxococcales bacterium]|nr:hypothetical protein [Myxococcales bacterium]
MRASRLVPFLVFAPAALAAACGGAGKNARSPDGGSFRAIGIGASADPTVRGARLLPETVDDAQGYGNEPGGGLRAITAGLRVVTTHEGAIVTADDRLPQAPQLTTALPERLGGGFLFVLGTTIWRADHWLDTARPIFASLQAIQAIVPGLDRVYVRAQNAYLAIDGKTGNVLDLGPWPASPFVSGFAAADGWRAAAVTDLRGVVATYDAGATWRALDLPMEPRQVLVSGDSLAIGGIENAKTEAWFEARADGTVARLSGPPREAKGKTMLPAPGNGRTYYPGGFPGGYPGGGYPGGIVVPVPMPTPSAQATTRPTTTPLDSPPSPHEESVQDAGTRIFGKRPLAAAIEDGWPLTDGTAVVARDGALGRVRLSDGALTEIAQGAFPLKPARCHPLPLTRPNAIGAFGFVCGEPRGATAIYAYDPLHGRLTELRRFDRPRVVTSSGNGALAVRGPCAEDGDASATPREPTRIETKTDGGSGDGGLAESKSDGGKSDKDEHADKNEKGVADKTDGVHPFCIFGHDGTWREVHVRGDVGGERVVVLADGKIAVISPPQGQAAPARITLLDKGRATTLPVAFPKVTADVARVLRLGVWLDGFEERRPGVVGGWIEAGGAMLGVEIALDGQATPGQFIRDAGMPFVSGRYGFGWTQSRRGFETTDGGMTWTSLELPEPLVQVNKVERRACGPVGCLAAGWLRVGWGEPKKPPVPAVPPPHRSTVTVSPPQLSLACEGITGTMPIPPPPRIKAPSTTVPPAVTRRTFGGPPVLAASGIGGVTDMPAFFAQPAPALRESERGMPFEVQDLAERFPRLGSLARIYAWGPKGGDWDTQGKWQVRWLSPFSAWPETRSSLPVVPPATMLDYTKQSSVYGGFGASYYSAYSGMFAIATGDDSSHALLLARRTSRTEMTPIELEADRAPVEIHRADGEPFIEIDAVTRAAGRWFIATPPPAGASSPVTIIWQVDGSVARELVRVSRAAVETGRPTGTRLARRSDGRAIGLVVDGQPTAERTTPTRWVLPIDLETAQLGEPEPLGYSDLAGRTLEACTDDVVGWSFDTSFGGTAHIRLPQGSGSMHSLYARIRLTTTRACIERIAGMYDGQTPERAAQLTRSGAHGGSGSAIKPGELIASALSAQARYGLRCTLAKDNVSSVPR